MSLNERGDVTPFREADKLQIKSFLDIRVAQAVMKFVDKRNELKATGSSSTIQAYFLKQNLEEQLQNSEPNDLFRRFSIDLARYTGFSRHPNSNSWEFYLCAVV